MTKKRAATFFLILLSVQPTLATESWLCLSQDRTYSYENQNAEKAIAQSESLRTCLKQSPQPEKCRRARCVAEAASPTTRQSLSFEQRELMRQQFLKNDWERRAPVPQTVSKRP